MKHWQIRLCTLFVVALILSILPMPTALALFKPPWILLILLYLAFFIPAKSNLITLVFLGLILDVLLSTIMGAHAFALVATLGLAWTRARRFHFFPMTQQMLMIGFFCFMYQGILIVINALSSLPYSLWIPVLSAILGMFFWPWVKLLGDEWLLSRFAYVRR